MAKNLKEGVYFVSKITCSFLSGFVTTRAAAVLKMVGQPKVTFLTMSQVLPVFHHIGSFGDNFSQHLCVDRKGE